MDQQNKTDNDFKIFYDGTKMYKSLDNAIKEYIEALYIYLKPNLPYKHIDESDFYN